MSIRQLIFSLPLVALLGCGDDADPEVYFDHDLASIVDGHCAQCHNPQGPPAATGLNLFENPYEALVGKPSISSTKWTLVVPGDLERSLLYRKVSRNPPFGQKMPPLDDLDDNGIKLFRLWIEQGARKAPATTE